MRKQIWPPQTCTHTQLLGENYQNTKLKYIYQYNKLNKLYNYLHLITISLH